MLLNHLYIGCIYIPPTLLALLYTYSVIVVYPDGWLLYTPTVDCCIRTTYSHIPFSITVICHHIFHIFQSVDCCVLYCNPPVIHYWLAGYLLFGKSLSNSPASANCWPPPRLLNSIISPGDCCICLFRIGACASTPLHKFVLITIGCVNEGPFGQGCKVIVT